MRLAEIRRYPVKSLLGEELPAAAVGWRGMDGDRLWAVRDADGKFGSGKNTRRFRRMAGLFDLRAYGDGDVPSVTMADGRTFRADDPAAFEAVSAHLGRSVTLAREDTVPHHDEGPVSVITTAGLRALSRLAGRPVEATRFRANLLIDVPGTGFPEDAWVGRPLRIGPSVILRPQRPLTRCVMVDMAQDGLPARDDLLKRLAEAHDLTFGLWATVLHPGTVGAGDECALV
ncbi:MOSC domain-containing protein [Actinoplanes sp. CA-030573]|uniref:MOSC domain-containing protein n=1 Tax=Actinoplanes sp. CA-030573 TaxID=3239898 RepID=UPI003D8AB15F